MQYNVCHHNLYAICLLAACHGLFGIVHMQPLSDTGLTVDTLEGD